MRNQKDVHFHASKVHGALDGIEEVQQRSDFPSFLPAFPQDCGSTLAECTERFNRRTKVPPKSELSAFLVALGMLLSPEPTALPLHSLSIKISVSCRFEVGTSGLGKKDSHSVLGFEMRLEFPVLGARKTVGLSPEHKVLIVGHGLLEHFVWVISNKGIRTCKALKMRA